MKGKFTRLVLENWRNFKKVDVALGERVFVVGANASGKSNLLDVFRFLQELAVDGGGLTNALDRSNRGGFRAVRSLHAGQNSAVRILVEAEIDGVAWSYDLKLQATGTSRRAGPAVVEKEVVLEGGERKLNRPDASDKKDSELLFATALEQRSANSEFRPLRDFLRSLDYIHLVPQLVRQPKAEDQTRFGKGLGTGLIEAIWLTGKQERTRRLKRIERGLRHVLPQFESLEVEPDSAGRPHLRAKYKHWRRSGGCQEESAFSDGTLRLVWLLWYLSGGNSPLLLEEPEMSLHPAAVRQIPRILADLNTSTGRQILMSSHSPELLGDRGIDPSEVLLLRASKDATDVTVGSDEPSLVEAAEADLPLGPYLEALTRPANWSELAQFGSAG